MITVFRLLENIQKLGILVIYTLFVTWLWSIMFGDAGQLEIFCKICVTSVKRLK